MAAYKQQLNIANFICKFGENNVLLDLCNEVVIPAFMDGLVRKIGDSNYFLYEVELVNLSNESKQELAISGRFVKQTKVIRDQIFEDGQIVKDHKELDSAPTSFFTLLLSNHKLLYVRETSGAPLLQTFAGTIEYFLKKKHKIWIDRIFDEKKVLDESIKKIDIFKEWPSPSLDIVELSTDTDIQKFVKTFKVINSVEIRLVNTNHEIDNSGLFVRLRDVKDTIGADKLSVKTEKAGEVGLNKNEIVSLISAPAEDGNSRILVYGKNLEGEKMKAENDQFKVSIPVKTLSSEIGRARDHTIEAMESHIRAGIFSLKQGSEIALSKLANVIEQLRQ